MKTRKLRIDLEIDVRELTDRELDDSGSDGGEVDGLDEVDPFELAEVVVGMFHRDAVQEAFAGSGIFLTFNEEPLVIAAEWVPETPSPDTEAKGAES